MTDLPVVDAHQHFWDLERNYLPWLCDEPPIPFRYGDYSALRRNYLPADYLRDAAGHDVVKTVYVETEWDPRDSGRRDPMAAGDRRRRAAFRTRSSPARGSTIPTSRRCSRATPRSRRCAASGTSRRAAPSPERRAGRARRARWAIRPGAAATRCSRGTGCRSTCRRPGGILARRRRSRAISRTHRSSSTTPACRRTAAPRVLPAGAARWQTLAAAAQRRGQDLRPRPARPAVDGRGQRPDRARRDRDLRRRALHVREQLPGRRPVRRLRHDLHAASRRSSPT